MNSLVDVDRRGGGRVVVPGHRDDITGLSQMAEKLRSEATGFLAKCAGRTGADQGVCSRSPTVAR